MREEALAVQALSTEVHSPDFHRLIQPNAVLERIYGGCSFAEGPVWNAREGYLLWTDASENRILKWQPGTGVSTWLSPSGRALALTYDAEGRLVASGWSARTIWRRDHDGTISVLASHYKGVKINAPNDLVIRRDGSIYWTDSVGAFENPNFPGADVQQYLDDRSVFRLAMNGEKADLLPVAKDFESPNGLAFSPDESVLYVDDTARRHIRKFQVNADGTLDDGVIFFEDRGSERGGPDGMKVDIEGNVYCTGAGGVVVISPSGELLGRILLQAASNLAFGDADWRTLFITQTESVWRLRVEIPGIPVG